MDRFTHKTVFLCISLVALLIFSVLTSIASSEEIKISFINVGQGDAALIHDMSGHDILIDGGKTSAGPTVVAFIRNQHIDDIDVIIATHADSDHIGGLIDVLNSSDIPIESVYYNGYPGDTATWDTFAAAVASRGITLTVSQYPQTYTWGLAEAYILNPLPGLTNPEQNDASVVVLLDYGEVEALFTGDIDTSVEAEIIARQTPIASDILKVAHHGSAYSSSAVFLEAVSPKEAVISVGVNSYGHPADETLARLIDAGARIWRTDQSGTIYVISDGFTYEVTPEIPLSEANQYLPALHYYVSLIPTATPTLPPTPTSTQIILPTPTFTSTPEPPTPTPEPDVDITYILYDGAEPYYEGDEYAEITNKGSGVVNLQGWRLNAGDPGQNFYFPSYDIQPGQKCRVYTDEVHPETCGFSFRSGSALWNNSGDCGYLYNASGAQVSSYCY